MKSLVIATHYPLPEDSGMNIRTMNFVRALKNMGEVDLAYMSGNGLVDGVHYFEQELYLERNDDNQHDESTIGRLRRIMSGRPWMIRQLADESLRTLSDLIERRKYDVIICRYIHSAWSLLKLPAEIRRRIIIDLDDIISDSLYELHVGQAQSLRQKMRKYVDYLQLKSFQSKCLKFGAVVFCSSEDLRNNSACQSPNVFVIPNVSCQSPNNDEIGKAAFCRRRTLLFVGSLGYQPNVDGLLWFLKDVMPKVLSVIPDIQLLVIGRNPGQRVADACKVFNCVHLHANVPNVEEYYSMSGCSLVPLLSGGGTRIKILEAGLFGLPVLSTPVGAYGLGLSDDENILFFDNADQFIKNLLRLDDSEKFNYITSSMRNHILNNFSPDVFDKRIKEVVNYVMSKQ